MKKMSNMILVLVCLVSLTSSCGNGGKKDGNHQPPTDNMQPLKSTLLSPNEFESKLSSMPNAQLVDVRTPGEVEKGYIKGAINVDYQGSTFAADIEKLDKTKPTFVYCQSGGRSAESCLYMTNHGFKELYELKNGFGAWKNENKPVEIK